MQTLKSQTTTGGCIGGGGGLVQGDYHPRSRTFRSQQRGNRKKDFLVLSRRKKQKGKESMPLN